MEERMRQLPPEQLLEQYRQLLEDETIKQLPLVITGNSMAPFLIHGRDTVYLSRFTGPARRGDMLLYRRDSGRYVLHRVFRLEGETLTMLGDGQNVPEPGIRPEQVLARVTGVLRKGRLQSPGSFWWWFFETVWIRIVPLRCGLERFYCFFKKSQNRTRKFGKK